ncbi:MAG: PAS domain S-box protein, partial [Chloroflexota bacterium]
ENIKRLGPAVIHALEERKGWLERKRAEEQLRESEERYRALAEAAPDAIYVIDREDRVRYVNTVAAALLGVRPEEAIGQPRARFFPEVSENQMADLKLVLESGRPIYTERETPLPGGVRWLGSWLTPLKNLTGQPDAVMGISRDITERKQAETERQALLEIAQGMAATSDLSELLRLIHRSIGRVIYAENFLVILYNQETRLFEEVYSVDKYDLPAPPSALEKSVSAYVFRTGEPLLLTEARFEELVAQGEVKLVGTNSPSWLGAPLKSGGETIGVMAVQDYENPNRYSESQKDLLVSIASQVALAIQRKQAEEAVYRSERRFRSLVENGFDEVSLLAADGRLIYESPSADPLLGYAPGQYLGQDMFQLIHPEDLQRVRSQYARLARDPGLRARDQFRLRHNDGSWRWVEAVGTNLLAEPAVQAIVINYHDITERKRAEAGLEIYARQQAALYRLSSDLASALEETEVCQTIARALHDTLGYDYLGLFLLDKATGERVLQAKIGWSSAPDDWRIPPGQGVSEHAILSGRLHYTPDVRLDPRYVAGQGTGAEVDVPIKIGGEAVGVLIAESNQPEAFNQQDFEALTAAANQTSLALQRAREHRAVKEAEILYRDLFNTVPVGIYRTTLEGRWLAANPTLAQTLGYESPEELIEEMTDLD